jgi:pimeloyl-ACP methyl ester carboxylesterase
MGQTQIAYELGAIFSPQKPTVFIIADAQQFYIRKGVVAQLQSSLFDSTFNVIGIIGRNNNEDLKKSVLDKDGNIDWIKAHQIFCWEQYVSDIDEVRKKVVGIHGKILLYGQSGGGFLVHQYLSIYGRYIDRAFTAAAVNYQLDHESGINHDKFWEEATRQDSAFAGKFLSLSKIDYFSRELVAMLFQRQNFFVKTDSLQFEKENLLNALLRKDTSTVNKYIKKYQIDAIQSFYTSPDGIPIKVRLFEFIFPLLNSFKVKSDTLMPDLENLYYSTLPLIEAYHKNQIKPQSINFSGLHTLNTEVFILSGRWDHTADSRSQIALASVYPLHYLFLANDNHTFISLKKEGMYSQLLTAFLKSGINSNLTSGVLAKCEGFRWKE